MEVPHRYRPDATADTEEADDVPREGSRGRLARVGDSITFEYEGDRIKLTIPEILDPVEIIFPRGADEHHWLRGDSPEWWRDRRYVAIKVRLRNLEAAPSWFAGGAVVRARDRGRMVGSDGSRYAASPDAFVRRESWLLQENPNGQSVTFGFAFPVPRDARIERFVLSMAQGMDARVADDSTTREWQLGGVLTFREAVAACVLELAGPGDLESFAVIALAEGHDTLLFRQLVERGEARASLGESHAQFLNAVAEAGLERPPLRDAALTMRDAYAREVVLGRMSPFEGARRIYQEVFKRVEREFPSKVYEGDAFGINRLFALYIAHRGVSSAEKRAEIDKAIIDECRSFAHVPALQ